ncbi:MAG: chorion class high-cysteine HCB protein 13 [Butyrivibrio sp.]|nr:chorion class high-cysteine HCB protein 13 [Acetatifactor muris]MCM1559231.1 chorion class high-cysteine HCB protein 13 [Butyrivibrio sp.]
MSDLTATNCGCNDSCGCANAQNNNGFGGCFWIILLLLFCGNGTNSLSGGNGCGCGNGTSGLFGGNGGCCEWIIWILLLSYFCGNGNGCGCGC